MTTLVFDSPRPSTRSTKLIETSASITGPGSLAAATMSMSPIISEKRRSEPQYAACVTPGTSRRRSSTRSASGSAIQIGVRSSERSASRLATARASFSSDFAPKPSSSRTRCSASARRRSSIGVHAQLAAQLRERLRSQALDAQQRDHARRVLLAQRLELPDPARLEQLADLLGGALADPLDLAELLERELPEVSPLRGDRLPSGLVGAHPKGLGTSLVDLRELGELAQHLEHVLLRIAHDR